MSEPPPATSWIDRVVGGLADRVLAAWDSPRARRWRRYWRHRRRVARIVRWRVARHRRVGRPYLAIERAVTPIVRACGIGWQHLAAGARWIWRWSTVGLARLSDSRAVQGMDRAEGAVRRFWRAHASAWRWLGRTVSRPFRRAAERRAAAQAQTEADAARPAMAAPRPAILRCAACGHESMGVGLAKYSSFACPRCGAPLLVIDYRRGRTTVGTAAGADRHEDAEKAETEGMITPLTTGLEPVGSDDEPTPRSGTRVR